MEQMPAALVDFASALKMLAEAQSDIAEIVTKWDLICDTTTPRTVKIALSNHVHEVDNLAKIREDLVKGLSLEYPEVFSIKLKTKYGPGTGHLSATQQTAKTWISGDGGSFTDPYEKYESNLGIVRNLNNTYYSCRVAQKPEIRVSLFELARFIWLGYPASATDEHISEYNLYIKAPAVNEALYASNRQYCTLVTFIGANTSYDGSVSYGAVTLHIHHSDDDQQVTTVSIELGKMATFLVWAAPGQNSVPILRVLDQEITD